MWQHYCARWLTYFTQFTLLLTLYIYTIGCDSNGLISLHSMLEGGGASTEHWTLFSGGCCDRVVERRAWSPSPLGDDVAVGGVTAVAGHPSSVTTSQSRTNRKGLRWCWAWNCIRCRAAVRWRGIRWNSQSLWTENSLRLGNINETKLNSYSIMCYWWH